jgi:hypothetical protein
MCSRLCEWIVSAKERSKAPRQALADSACAPPPRHAPAGACVCRLTPLAPAGAYGAALGTGLARAPSPYSSSASISAPTRTTSALSHSQSSKTTGAASDP